MNINEKCTALNTVRKKLQLLAALYSLLLIAVVAFLFLNPTVSYILFAAGLIFYFFFMRTAVKKYRCKVKTAVLEEGLRSCLKGISYRGKNYLPSDSVDSWNFFPDADPKAFFSFDCLTGSYQGKDAVLCDISTHYSKYTSPKGSQKAPVYVNGCWLGLSLPSDSGLNIRIIHKSLFQDQLSTSLYNMSCDITSLQSSEFQNLFRCYSENGSVTLPENLQKSLINLQKYTPGSVFIGIRKNSFAACIQNRFLYTGRVPVRMNITAEFLSHLSYPELPYILRVSDCLF